jgi:hypothetical protein
MRGSSRTGASGDLKSVDLLEQFLADRSSTTSTFCFLDVASAPASHAEIDAAVAWGGSGCLGRACRWV